MKTRYFLLMIVAIFTSCDDKEPVVPYQELFGAWELTQYVDGSDGITYFPGRDGEVNLLTITEDFNYQRTLNGDAYSSGRIIIENKESIVDGETYDIIGFENEFEQAVLSVSGSSLVLRDECINCNEYTYVKR